jgi:hypothetical protein
MKLLDRIENALVYRLDWYDGQIYIDVIGYHYNAGEPSIEGEDKTWRYNMFRGYEMPLSEFLASTEEDRAGWEEEYTRWIDDLTEQEVIEYFTDDNAPVSRLMEDITEEDAHAYCEMEFIDAIY